jgi:diguanylate cyclase (GGDEF)-like protein
MVLGFSILAILLSVIVSRAMIGPLNMMVRAAKRFSTDRAIAELPVRRNDELGLLARSFKDMQTQINAHLSELYDSQRDVDHLARHDPLTGLANRLMLYDRLEHAISASQRTGRNIALIYLDLDRFKEINDTRGHAIGDKVLKAVSNRLKKMVREVDTVARLGGDEFVILFDSIEDPRQVVAIAGKIIDAFRLPLEIDGEEYRIGVSLGISVYPQDADNATRLIEQADTAMYRAKKAGGNTFELCNPIAPMQAQSTFPL